MKSITCPAIYTKQPDSRSIFVAGGISNCPDWQKEMIDRFKECGDDLHLINPRRTSFAIENPEESSFQIEWEHQHLHDADAIIFWFPFQTLCPITLFELGVFSNTDVPLFIGCHPAYARKFDVEKQLSLIRPKLTVHDSFEGVVKDAMTWYTAAR